MQRGRDKRKDLAHLEFSKRAEPLENLLHWRREHLKKRRIKNLIRRGHVPEATTKLPHPAFFEKSRSKSRPIETYALEIETHALEEQEHESINNQEDKTASSIHVFARIREPPRRRKRKNSTDQRVKIPTFFSMTQTPMVILPAPPLPSITTIATRPGPWPPPPPICPQPAHANPERFRAILMPGG